MSVVVYGFALCFFLLLVIFFFNDTATTEIYTLSLHDALPISDRDGVQSLSLGLGLLGRIARVSQDHLERPHDLRSEEHTSELQSHVNLVCRLLLEKKKKNINIISNVKTNNNYK